MIISENGKITEAHFPTGQRDLVVANEQPYENWKILRTADGWTEITLRHDCIDLRLAHNVPFYDGDTGEKLTDAVRKSICASAEQDMLHICDLDQLIALLQAVKVHWEQHEGRI